MLDNAMTAILGVPMKHVYKKDYYEYAGAYTCTNVFVI